MVAADLQSLALRVADTALAMREAKRADHESRQNLTCEQVLGGAGREAYDRYLDCWREHEAALEAYAKRKREIMEETSGSPL